MTFKTHAVIEHVPDRDRWIVAQPLVYEGEINITVAPGFETDLATIPRIFWWLIPQSDKHIVEASIIHDYMYSGAVTGVTRVQADRILREACREMKGPSWYDWIVWVAVRIGGNKGWRRRHGLV